MATVYVSLHTDAPASAANEAAYRGYARVQAECPLVDLTKAFPVRFPVATGGREREIAFAVWGPESDEPLLEGRLALGIQVNVGTSPEISQVSISEHLVDP